MGSPAEEQTARILPPRKSHIFAITTDTTARAYDISGLELGNYTPEADLKRRNEVMLTVQAEGADLYLYFHTATDTAMDKTAAVAASAATAAYVATHCAYIPVGNERTYTIDRSIDKFIVVQGSAAGKARIFATSAAY
jgi:hypothetical protein